MRRTPYSAKVERYARVPRGRGRTDERAAGRPGALLAVTSRGRAGVAPPLVRASWLLRSRRSPEHQPAALRDVRRGARGPRRGQAPRPACSRRATKKGWKALPDRLLGPTGVRGSRRGAGAPRRLRTRAGGGRVNRLCVGFDRLTRRPRAGSVRFKAQAGAGMIAATGLAVATWIGVRVLRVPKER